MTETTEPVAAESPPAKEEPKPIWITMDKAKQFLSRLKHKRCYLIDLRNTVGDKPSYYKGWGNGQTCNIEEAFKHTPNGAMESISTEWDRAGWNNTHIQLADQELAAALLKKRCCIEGVLSAAIIGLLKLAPMNPQARAHVLAEAGKLPPDSADTYEKLVDWIEENCGPDPNEIPKELSVPTPRPATTSAIEVTVDFSQTEVGTCRYCADQTGTARHRFSSQELWDILNNNPEARLDELTELVCFQVHDDPWGNLEPEMEASGNSETEYSRYSSDGTDNENHDIRGGRTAVANLLTDYLRTILTPEQQRARGL